VRIDMTYEIKKIDVWSVVKIAFILYGIFGLIFGLFYALLLTFLGGILSQFGGDFGQISGFFTGAVGILMAFFIALFYAVIGAIFTAIFVWLYNVLAKLAGGIRFNLEGEKIATPPPAEKPESDSEGMLGKYKYE
jgi:uncharacterized BrkB/YihY/UPF0761 family membrane protein